MCKMISYDELKVEIETLELCMSEEKKNSCTFALKKVRGFGFAARILKVMITQGKEHHQTFRG